MTGAEDPRRGKVVAVLASDMHGDHVGDRDISAVNAGERGAPDLLVIDAPDTNTVRIALAKDAKIGTGGEMPGFSAGKLQALGGDPKASRLVRFGASRRVWWGSHSRRCPRRARASRGRR